MSCRSFTCSIRSSTAQKPGPTPGGRQAWSGRLLRRRPKRILQRRRPCTAGPTTTTRRKPKMSPEYAILTPEEEDELAGTVLVRRRLEEQYANLEHQHETASLGMWIFLATEVMFFGVL